MRRPLPANPLASTLHLDWTRANDPAREHQVVDRLDTVEKVLARRLRDRGALMAALTGALTRAALPESHLPWYWGTRSTTAWPFEQAWRVAPHGERETGVRRP